jgi:Barstar (barnase inhibitor)
MHDVPGQDPDVLAEQLRAQGWGVYVLPASMTDGEEFIVAAKAMLPLDPPLMSNDNWNALSDSLWEGLYESGHDRIAIVWPGSGAMAVGDRDSFENARAVLSLVAETLSDPKATVGHPKTLTVLLT